MAEETKYFRKFTLSIATMILLETIQVFSMALLKTVLKEVDFSNFEQLLLDESDSLSLFLPSAK